MDRGRLDAAALERQIAADEIDTVVVAFTDLQGRLVGKRVTGRFFSDSVLAGGVEACNYLLAVDVDMAPLPGYRFASWEQGYGDLECRPDLATLRRIPWLDKTALVLCDVFGASGQPVEVSPRQILRRQVERAAALGFTVMCGSELEFYLFRDSYEEARAKGYADLTYHAPYVQDYHVLQTTRDEYVIRVIRNGMEAAGVPVEFSKGEAGPGQHEINLQYADALEMADRHVIYKNGAKEIAGLAGRAITFMAKYAIDQSGSSCHIHSSLWDRTGGQPQFWGESEVDHWSPVFRNWLGGLVLHTGELTWLFAPTVNSYKRYQPASWAPTALVWGLDNRTCGFRVVGDGPTSLRVESRVPGADCNPYLAFAATIAAGLHGLAHEEDPGARFDGNAYEAGDVARVPSTVVDAIAALEQSTLAADAFGAEVHQHLVNTAQQEWASFGAVVTDWERRRCFEQL
ncbi:MAG TPA: glutamine synthetase family protein [Acidimicrobiia bacterium]|jgi:glutamine synthetase|nr:glutamine synthetase family protein [Acidimicrobiia bacterium]